MAFNFQTITAFVFGLISFIIIYQNATTVYSYNKDNKDKDAAFFGAAFMLALGIIGLLISAGMFFTQGKSTNAVVGTTSPSEVAGSNTNLGTAELGLANKLERVAANSQVKATRASEGAKLASALGATLGQLK